MVTEEPRVVMPLHDPKCICPDVLFCNKPGLFFRIAASADTDPLSLTNRIESESDVLSDHTAFRRAVRRSDLTLFRRQIALEEFPEGAFTDKADTGGVLLLGNRQPDLFRDGADFSLHHAAHRENRAAHLLLRETVQEVTLILPGIRSLQKLHRAVIKAAGSRIVTCRDPVRAHIDRVIENAYTFDSFLMLLRRLGYVVQNQPNRKYVTVLPPGGKRAIRLDSLGDGYTEQDIRTRLAARREGAVPPAPVTKCKGRRYRIKGKHPTVPKRKITGFQTLYLRYLYLLRGTRKKTRFRRVPFSVRQEVVRLERYDRQFRYLWANGLTTAEDLEQRIAALERETYNGEQQRKPLYRERRDAEDEEGKARCSAEIDRQTASLREKRRELTLCHGILADVPHISQQVEQAEAMRQKQVKKEEKRHEYQR